MEGNQFFSDRGVCEKKGGKSARDAKRGIGG